HPGIVTTIATGIYDSPDGKVPYQVTSPLSGTTVAQALERHVIPVEVARAIVARVAGTVADVHRQDFVHGLLRPAAVRVLDSGQVVVSGWGLDREVAVEHRQPRGSTQRDDAVALATMFARAITGEDLEDIDT